MKKIWIKKTELIITCMLFFILGIILNSNTTKILGSGTSNSSGAFKLESTIDLGTGIYTVIAEGKQGSSASAPLLISLYK